MAHLPEKIVVTAFVIALPLLVVWKIKTSQVLGTSIAIKKDYSQEITFWQFWEEQHPDYRDGYVKLAELYKKQGNLPEARFSLQKVFQLDPNFQVPPSLAGLQ